MKSRCKRLGHKEQYKAGGTELQSSLLCGVVMLIAIRFACNFYFPIFEVCFCTMQQTCIVSAGKTSCILNLGTR